eukprot:jgi/Ulvmu1/981/UM103_0008.1
MMQFLNGTQWLDNFYFRLQRTRVDPNCRLLELGWSAPRALVDSNADVPTSQVFVTNCLAAVAGGLWAGGDMTGRGSSRVGLVAVVVLLVCERWRPGLLKAGSGAWVA